MKRYGATRWSSPATLINAAYAGLLVILAVVPRSLVVPDGFGLSDGVAHAVAYGVQGSLLTWALRPVLGAARGGLGALIGASAFGLFTEMLQSVLPYRDFGFGDLGADALGAAVGTALALACGFGGRDQGGPR